MARRRRDPGPDGPPHGRRRARRRGRVRRPRRPPRGARRRRRPRRPGAALRGDRVAGGRPPRAGPVPPVARRPPAQGPAAGTDRAARDRRPARGLPADPLARRAAQQPADGAVVVRGAGARARRDPGAPREHAAGHPDGTGRHRQDAPRAPGRGKPRRRVPGRRLVRAAGQRRGHGRSSSPRSRARWASATTRRAARSTSWRRSSSRSRRLLVLDNLEQVRGAGSDLGELLRRARRIRILATSRAPLRISGEQEYPVPGLPTPPDLDRLGAARARAAARRPIRAATRRRSPASRRSGCSSPAASSVEPGFAITGANAGDVAAIVAHLGGVPLAIELAAARIRFLTPAAIHERLEGRLDLLGARRRATCPERQRSLRGAIVWSHDLLDAPAAACSSGWRVFMGGFDLTTAEAVGGPAAGPRRGRARRRSASLVDQSLAPQRRGRGEPRFRMLEPIREFALERLEARGEAAAVRERHARASWPSPSSPAPELTATASGAALDRLELEHANLRAAHRLGGRTADAEVALGIAIAVWRMWQKRGHLREARIRVAALIACQWFADAPPELRADAHEVMGGIIYWHGQVYGARPDYEAALAIWREVGDRREIAERLLQPLVRRTRWARSRSCHRTRASRPPRCWTRPSRPTDRWATSSARPTCTGASGRSTSSAATTPWRRDGVRVGAGAVPHARRPDAGGVVAAHARARRGCGSARPTSHAGSLPRACELFMSAGDVAGRDAGARRPGGGRGGRRRLRPCRPAVRASPGGSQASSGTGLAGARGERVRAGDQAGYAASVMPRRGPGTLPGRGRGAADQRRRALCPGARSRSRTSPRCGSRRDRDAARRRRHLPVHGHRGLDAPAHGRSATRPTREALGAAPGDRVRGRRGAGRRAVRHRGRRASSSPSRQPPAAVAAAVAAQRALAAEPGRTA